MNNLLSRCSRQTSWPAVSNIQFKKAQQCQHLSIPSATRYRRHLSTVNETNPEASPKTGVRLSTLFYTLIALGVVSTSYGLYEIYKMFTQWPPALRPDLRAAIDAKHKGNFPLSAKHFQRAYDMALELPVTELGEQPYLKISGVAIALGEVLELANQPAGALESYTEALELMRKHKDKLTGPERLRTVALAHKLGALAQALGRPSAEEEQWRVFAVEEALRLAKDTTARPSHATESADAALVVLAELDLPRWLHNDDVGAPIEALGEFYGRTGRLDYALPLYLQAISMLVPPPNSPKKATSEELCRGAELMSNMAELIVRDGALTRTKIHQAEAWARKALEILDKASSSRLSGDAQGVCDQAYVVTLFNLASLREMGADPKAAKEYFQRAHDTATRAGIREGTAEARMALMRLARAESAAAPKPATPEQ
ncbi:hypothetical protein PENSPDRAFT_643482 [Peniophora sp. CONT]|nr:hypothetical protein PENSPDRAFT_643482 [Peniophora sp. CONT]